MNTPSAPPSDEPRSSSRMDARLDAVTRAKVDDLAQRFHQPRAAVVCHIMPWSLSRGPTEKFDGGASEGPARHLYLYVEIELHRQVEQASAAAGMNIAPWLRLMVRQISMMDFPASWEEERSAVQSHDSRVYDTRFMLRLDKTSQAKLQQLISHFGVSKATIIRRLIMQATPEDFPQHWQMRAAEHSMPSVRQRTRNNREITR